MTAKLDPNRIRQRKPRPTKAEMQARRLAERMPPCSHYDTTPTVATGIRICNTNTTGSYRTGDGEVRQAIRPASEVAFTLPSRGIKA